jgi:predicted glycosyltransferase involved in capsule biosynthesis
MTYEELLKKQIGKECTFISNHAKCTINFGSAEPFASEGIIEDVTDDYVVIKSQGSTMIYLLVNTAISY